MSDPTPAPADTPADLYALAGERIAVAPLPTAATLRRRSNLPLQLWRFGLINLKIVRMVLKGHH